jgi:asparagine synthase (glutamine-hydrolysing)
MGMALAHRGPDSSGVWYDEAAGIGLSHRRLAIIDLSEHGHQPMRSRSGRFVVSYNGEIFNFQRLRAELQPRGYVFTGHSDTEVMLAAIEEWGLADAVQRFVGMFAIALWDRHARTLSLVRDRLGVKPLYYTRQGGILSFASELKALRKVAELDFDIDRKALWDYVRYSYVPSRQTIYRKVLRLDPGHILTVKAGDTVGELRSEPYWLPPRRARISNTEVEEAADCLDGLLKDAVSLRLLSDVPIGLFLSGGIDSSLVCAIAQSVSSTALNTYSIGFTENQYNESARAAAIARVLGTNHTELVVSEADALATIPLLPEVYDEPFGDSSQIPTMLLCRLARQNVTVALSGDGGDEVFAGYDRYFLALRLWSAGRRLPRPLAAATSAMLRMPSPSLWDGVSNVAAPLLPARYKKPEFGSRVHRFAAALEDPSFAAVYERITHRWNDIEEPLVRDVGSWQTCGIDRPVETDGDAIDAMTRWDLVGFLPDDILTKLDRASMAVALEARVPLLDHRVVEFAMQLPFSMKVRNGQGKWLLRQLLHRYIPEKLWDRPKQGFNIPLAHWLRGDLRDWAEPLLDPLRLEREGFFDGERVVRRWRQHLAQHRDWSYELWNVLMFQAWIEHTHPELTAR